MAIAGDAISITTGNSAAPNRMRRASSARTVIAVDDNSTTGNSEKTGIDHSELISARLATAPTTGSNSGAQNAVAATRRSFSRGQMMSASIFAFGRAVARAMIIGTAA